MRPLYCDESIWIPVADGLRRRGWTVHTARDRETLGDPDREQLRYAVENIVAFASLRSLDRTTACDRMSNQLQTLL